MSHHHGGWTSISLDASIGWKVVLILWLVRSSLDCCLIVVSLLELKALFYIGRPNGIAHMGIAVPLTNSESALCLSCTNQGLIGTTERVL